MADNMTLGTAGTYNISLWTAKKRLKEIKKDLAAVKEYLEEYYAMIDGQGNGASKEDDYTKSQLEAEQRLHQKIDFYEKIMARPKQNMWDAFMKSLKRWATYE